MKKGGHFITFEGGEGSGKTSHIARLHAYLAQKGYDVIRTREPGGTKLGDRLRSLILDVEPGTFPIDSRTELLLYLASRAQHVTEVISPALAAGKLVLCDRFSDATMAYQGGGRGFPGKILEEMVSFASQARVPDLTFFLDIDVNTGLKRIAGRGEGNRLDQETVSFHEAVRREYQRLARAHPHRIHTIHTSGPVEEVAVNIKKVIDDFLS